MGEGDFFCSSRCCTTIHQTASDHRPRRRSFDASSKRGRDDQKALAISQTAKPHLKTHGTSWISPAGQCSQILSPSAACLPASEPNEPFLHSSCRKNRYSETPIGPRPSRVDHRVPACATCNDRQEMQTTGKDLAASSPRPGIV